MKKILTILFLLPLYCMAQSGRQGTSSQSLDGEIHVPPLQSITVELVSSAPINFETPEDINSPKIINGFYKVTVISSIPWVVKISAAQPYLSNGPTNKMPASSIELRGSYGFSPLTTLPISIQKSSNDKIFNVFYIDIKVKADIVFGSGKFMADLLFSISPD